MIRVIKLGGSLLTLPDWHERFQRWLATESPATNLLLIGGGELVNVLRREHERFPYTEKVMHDAALAVMDLNAELAVARLPSAILLECAADLERPFPPVIDRGLNGTAAIHFIHITSWWKAAVASGRALPPETWDTTSDTLAAWVAEIAEAQELVLLKSANPPARRTDWMKHGYVDRNFFQYLPEGICYRAVNLLHFKMGHVPRSA